MKNILTEFKQRGGYWFFSSSIIDKITRVSLTFFLTYILSKTENGIWANAMVIVSIFFPIKSLGIEAGILQHGTHLSESDKKSLFHSIFKRGFLIVIGFVLLALLSTFFLTTGFKDSQYLIFILSFWLLTYYCFEMLLNYNRIIKNHKQYAKIQSTYNILFAILLILGFWLKGTYGIASAFVLTPLIIFFLFFPEFMSAPKLNWEKINFTFKDIINFGFKTSLSNYASLLLFYLDVLLIQHLLNSPDDLAIYRTATIIPLNIPFIASIYLNNDYVHLVEKKLNKQYIKDYLFKYFKIFTLILLLSFLVLIPFADFIWEDLLFNGKYQDSTSIYLTLLMGTTSIILLRMPAGNILSALGFVNINTVVAYITLVFNFFLSYFLFFEFGLLGIAYGTIISLFLSGLIMMGYLIMFLKKK